MRQLLTLIGGLTLVVAFALNAARAAAPATQPSETTTMKDIALQKLETGDSMAAIEHVISHGGDAKQVTGLFGELQNELYWKKKNLALSVAMGRAGLQHGLTKAAELDASDAKQAGAVRAIAKGLAYDIASFTWVGWDEPGIAIGAPDKAVGLDAAKTNLRLAIELNKPPHPMSAAWWVLGAQQLATGDRAAATESFKKAAAFAREAKVPAEVLLNDGYEAIVQILDNPGDAALKAKFDAIKAELKPQKDGEFFAEQLDTTLRVFAK